MYKTGKKIHKFWNKNIQLFRFFKDFFTTFKDYIQDRLKPLKVFSCDKKWLLNFFIQYQYLQTIFFI